VVVDDVEVDGWDVLVDGQASVERMLVPAAIAWQALA
jgi:hypothetical protein